MKKRVFVIHPFFFAIYPILLLWGGNVVDVVPQDAVRPLLISLLAAIILLFGLHALTGNWHKAGFITTILLLGFYTYGHVYLYLAFTVFGRFFNPTPFLFIWLGLLLAFCLLIWRVERDLRPFTLYLNIAALATLVVPLQQITPPLYRWATAHTAVRQGLAEVPALKPPDTLPDIYYIVLDAYGREDVLAESYGYNNAPFLDALRERGFYVADASRTNYIRTKLALASALNMSYINYLADIYGRESRDVIPLVELIHHSTVRQALAAQGYEMVAVSSGFTLTEMRDADRYLVSDGSRLSLFEAQLLELSLMRDLPLIGYEPSLSYDAHRERVEFAFATLREIPKIEAPTFALIHMMVPHPPFVFTADGRFSPPERGFTLMDGNDYLGPRAEYLAGYPQQVAYVNGQLLAALDAILADSTVPPIIIVQGDHGPGAFLDWGSAENTCLKERTAIFNAYYVPPAAAADLYPTITPVNSFRVILNDLFGAELPLLDDRTYFSGGRPFDFTDVSEAEMPPCNP